MLVGVLIFGVRDDLEGERRCENQPDLLDVESVAAHLLKPDSVFAFWLRAVKSCFPEVMFADLFLSGRGRRRCWQR